MKNGEVPLFGFRKSLEKNFNFKIFYYMGEGPIIIVESSHFQNKWHSWALGNSCFLFFPRMQRDEKCHGWVQMGRSFACRIWSESFGKIATSRNMVVITDKFCLQVSFLACISFLYHDHFRLLVSRDFPLTLKYSASLVNIGCIPHKRTRAC